MTKAVTRPTNPIAGAMMHCHSARSLRIQKNATTARDAAACSAMMPSVPTPMSAGTSVVNGSAITTNDTTDTTTLATCGLKWLGW